VITERALGDTLPSAPNPLELFDIPLHTTLANALRNFATRLLNTRCESAAGQIRRSAINSAMLDDNSEPTAVILDQPPIAASVAEWP
jgi:hypothetical protein